MGRKREREAGEMDEERIDIARRFLVASPPGEVGNVARDVRALLGGDALLSDARAQSIFRELNLKHFTAVDMPNGSKALLTPYGEVSSALSQGEEGGMCRHYLEPESGTIIEVDHVKQTCIGQRDQKRAKPRVMRRGRSDQESQCVCVTMSLKHIRAERERCTRRWRKVVTRKLPYA